MDTWQVWLLDRLTCLCTSFPSYQYVLTNVLHGSPYKHLSSTVSSRESESEKSYICVFDFSIFPLKFGTVLTVWYFLFISFVERICSLCFVLFMFFFNLFFCFVLFWTLYATIDGLNLSLALVSDYFIFVDNRMSLLHTRRL